MKYKYLKFSLLGIAAIFCGAFATGAIMANESDAVFSDTFADLVDETGDGATAFTGSVSATKLTEREGWEGLTDAYVGQGCVRLGTSKNDGVMTTKTITLSGDATLTFDAAGWGTGTNKVAVTAEGATIEENDITLTNGEYATQTLKLTGATGTVKLTFTAKRMFMKNVLLKASGQSNPQPTLPITATWDFTNADVVAAAVALSGKTEAGTIENNGLALTIEANGQTIRNNGNSIQTGTPVVFKVPVQGKKDVVTVNGYPGYFAYSIAGTDATEATTTYTATAADVKQGYVEIVSKGQYIISISVTQNEDNTPTLPFTATWDFTNADVVAAAVALSGKTEAGTIENNGLALTIEANGQTIRNNGNSIQTGTPVVFKVPVQGKKDVVTVNGYPGYFAYSIAGTDATEATTTYTATAADVKQGYVEIVSKGQYIISISVTQNEDDGPQDITATWDFGNADMQTAFMALSGTNETGEVEAVEKNGLKMTVEANNATFRVNGNNMQIRKGTVFKVPVRNAGDLITVNGYPGYSYYTIGNSTEELNNENTYTAKRSDAEAGYVAVTSTNDNNYYYSISVVQYAPKEMITLTDEPATVKFPFGEGTEGQTATFTNAAYFLNSKVQHGESVVLEGKDNKSLNQTWFNPVAKDSKANEGNAIRFLFTPKPGFTFTPTKVSFKSTRFGTNGGKLDIAWQNPDGTTVSLATDKQPARDSETPNVSEYAYEVTGATVAEGTCGLAINLYSLDNGKHVGFSDIVIEGTLSGTEKEVPILASFKANGTEYAAEDVFGDAFEATLELPNGEKMVSAENPLTDVTAASGNIGDLTYEGTATSCKVTIPMTANDTQMNYILNVVYKPYFTLEYLDMDGKVLTTQQVEKGAAIGEFAQNIADVPATKEGYKARGWFKKSVLGEKYTTADVITANTKLYAIQTEIEEASTYKKYTFDLADKFFYAEDHEAFNPAGEGFYWHDAQHGWAFKPGNTFDLLVGPKATITITLCQYGYATGIAVKKDGETLETLPGMSDGDGGTAVFNYEGTAGTLTFELQGTGEMYIHGVKIVNTAEASYESQGNWYFVKAGDAKSLIEVLDVVNGKNAAKNAERSFIFLPDGVYDLDATVKTTITGHNISIIGQSMEKTIIVNKPDISIEGLGKADLLQNSGTNLYLQDLTLKNALDYYHSGSAGRAVALADAGTRTIGKNVRMLSYQDTYYPSNSSQQTYWETCDIHGTVDFICGGGDIRFQNTTISLEPRKLDGTGSRTVTAPTTTTKFGFVFDDCKVVDLSEGKGEWNFGRTWQNEPVCVWLNTTLDANAQKTLIASRWIEKGMNNKDPKVFGEYGTKDASGNNITPASNKITSHGGVFETILTAEQAAEYSYDKMFTNWDPALLATQVDATPANAKYDNGTVTFVFPKNGMQACAFFKNGEFVGISTNGTFNITVDPAKDELTVRAANQMGGLGTAVHVEGTVNGINATKVTTDKAKTIYSLSGQRVQNPRKGGLYIENGKKVIK